MDRLMDRWIDGGIGKFMDGWMDRLIDGSIGGWKG